ncbi:MAG: periplasmic heavy metal sensor [Pseudomonadota bacterium]
MTWGRVFRVGFVVIACISLLVNALIIGVGINLSKRGWFDREGGRAFLSIPRETRQTYIKDLRDARPELNQLRDDLRAKRKVMLETVAAEPLDPQALATALEEVRAATTRLQAAAHAVMLKTAEESAASDN